MRKSRGFTIVELIITITIMAILMTLLVVRLLSSQVAGRDKERNIDTTALANGLESFYSGGNPILSIPKGYYPGRQEVNTAIAATPPFKEFLEGVANTTYIAPKATITTSFGVDPATTAVVGANADGSYSDSQAKALLVDIPYLYQPLTRNNTLCLTYTNCVKFNLYYLTEIDNIVHVIRSRHQ